MSKILVVEDNKNFREMLKLNLEKADYTVEVCSSGEEALSVFERDLFDGGVFDLKLPEMDGLELLRKILEIAPDFPIIIITAYGDIETAVRAVKSGAWDFLQKPFDPDILTGKLEKAIKKETLPEEREIVGNSDELNRAVGLAKKVAETDMTALIYGESGTGKELFARAIHRWSDRCGKPFVVLNAAAIPEGLLESELFGIEGGTATGVSRRIGKISQADRGTLFLDEIGDMPLALQSKILRVIEDKSFEKVGGREKIKVDVRIICATNRDLEEMVEKGDFREDLFYRLNVFPIHLPPLRDRIDDIKPLIMHFIELYRDRIPNNVTGIEDRALLKLKNHEWRGNIRELENVIKRALILCEGEKLQESHLIFQRKRDKGEESGGFDLLTEGQKAKRKTEIKIIKESLRQTEGNKAEAARLLNISYKTLFNKINEYDIEEDIYGGN